MKKLLIGGCSFSEPKYGHGPWHPWTDQLVKEYSHEWEVTNKAQGSYGNALISQNIIDNILRGDTKPDLVIVQWSAIGRAYSHNETDFIGRLIKERDSMKFAPHMGEYLSQDDRSGWVTNTINVISENFYQSSLVSMIGLQSFLNEKNIPYIMFWGWCQFNDELKDKFKPYLDLLYNERWWNPDGSMSSFITEAHGKKGIMGGGDFHPNNLGQRHFYEKAVKVMLKDKRLLKTFKKDLI
tara:strand:+ start:1127 stop:1843 length:717 start_codon:yes stop_codon:yes gene_type:complete